LNESTPTQTKFKVLFKVVLVGFENQTSPLQVEPFPPPELRGGMEENVSWQLLLPPLLIAKFPEPEA
jgi:hypothetical protein